MVAYGIAGDWFASYLSNRKQFCSLGDQKSSESLVTFGTPQGSCQGPLLFIIYLNDFENCLELSKVGTYADDTHVTFTSGIRDRLIPVVPRMFLPQNILCDLQMTT